MVEIKVKYWLDELEPLCYVDGKSDWIDLRAAQDVQLKAGEFRLIPLGVSIALPEGYEAHIAPRSSTFKNYGILQTNSMGWWTVLTAETGTSGRCPSMPPGTWSLRKTPASANSASWKTSPG